jgi:ergothioneine biosynthesis protein EgtB
MGDAKTLLARYSSVRRFTEHLAEPLEAEDYVIQSMPDASPAKWHLAHTSWFFESLVLARGLAGYRPFHPSYAYLFNSYYESLGARHPRSERGLLSRPTVGEIYAYRAHVDEHIATLLRSTPPPKLAATLTLGLHHEQQHQELLLTDLKHALGMNPLRPAYRAKIPSPSPIHAVAPLTFTPGPSGVQGLGAVDPGFSFDNERPRHRVFLEPYSLGDRLVTNQEYLAFIHDDGYQRPELWLSEGFTLVKTQSLEAPLYWQQDGGQWNTYTLWGMTPIDESAPVSHVSYFEADAYARWAKARLPTEAEWESVARGQPVEGNFVESDALRPLPGVGDGGPSQLFGDTWEWTQSAYAPYPGFMPLVGPAGEYNGKFMVNQQVLRGGSCVSSASHLRATYRNFFAPHCRWQFSGIRLAKDG